MKTCPSEQAEAIVLAGGRLGPGSVLDRVCPRPVVPVLRKPLVSYGLNWLREGGVGDITVCANSASAFVRGRLGSGNDHGVKIDYYEDHELRGTGGCVRDVAYHGKAEVYVVIEGSVIPRIDLRSLLAAHFNRGSAVTVVVTNHHDHAGDDGIDQLVPTGIYVFNREAAACAKHAGYQDIKEMLIPLLHASGNAVLPYFAGDFCPKVGDAVSYLKANEWMLSDLTDRHVAEDGYRRIGESYVHESARVSPGATLMGSTLVGPGTEVSAGAVLVGPTVVGSGCTVGEGAVVSRSVIWDHCKLSDRSYTDQCIITEGAVVPETARFHDAIYTDGSGSS